MLENNKDKLLTSHVNKIHNKVNKIIQTVKFGRLFLNIKLSTLLQSTKLKTLSISKIL